MIFAMLIRKRARDTKRDGVVQALLFFPSECKLIRYDKQSGIM